MGAIGQFPPDAIDRALLLRANPDTPHLAFDLAMLVIADFSVPAFAVIFVAWELAYQASRRWPALLRKLPPAFLLMGVGTAAILVTVAASKPAAERNHFFLMAPLAIVGFVIAGRGFRHGDADALARTHRTFVVCLASGLVASVCREWIGDHLAFRPRPLSPSFHPWNLQLREILGETVRTGSSYVSGHATALFAVLTPMFWRTRDRRLRAALLSWATVHAATRLYLAAHFPFGVWMGSLLGMALGTLATRLLVRTRPVTAPEGLRGPAASL